MARAWRKAYESLKDVRDVEIANAKGGDITVAVVEASLRKHSSDPPKEKHLWTIFQAAHGNSSDRVRLANVLEKRLSKTSSWKVVLRILFLIHKILREGDSAFCDEFLATLSLITVIYRSSGRIGDTISISPWEKSIWTCKYAKFLAARLQLHRILEFDPVRIGRSHLFGSNKIIRDLPKLQTLLDLLLDCNLSDRKPALQASKLIFCALEMLLEDCYRIRASVSACVSTLPSRFLESSKDKATHLLSIYKRDLLQFRSFCHFTFACDRILSSEGFEHRYEEPISCSKQSYLRKMEECVAKAESFSEGKANNLKETTNSVKKSEFRFQQEHDMDSVDTTDWEGILDSSTSAENKKEGQATLWKAILDQTAHSASALHTCPDQNGVARLEKSIPVNPFLSDV